MSFGAVPTMQGCFETSPITLIPQKIIRSYHHHPQDQALPKMFSHRPSRKELGGGLHLVTSGKSESYGVGWRSYPISSAFSTGNCPYLDTSGSTKTQFLAARRLSHSSADILSFELCLLPLLSAG